MNRVAKNQIFHLPLNKYPCLSQRLDMGQAKAQFGGQAVRDTLLRMRKGRRPRIRSAAVTVLVCIGGPGVREAIDRLANDPPYEVRQDVLETLREFDAS